MQFDETKHPRDGNGKFTPPATTAITTKLRQDYVGQERTALNCRSMPTDLWTISVYNDCTIIVKTRK